MNRTRKTRAKAEIKTTSSVARDPAVVRKSSAENGEVRHTELTEALRRAGGDTEVIPVVEESLRVGRRSVETGRVRIHKVVREEQQVVDEPTRREEVTVERVPVNRYVEATPQPRQEGDTTVYPVVEEVVVVQRRLMLKEEVRVTKRVTETREPQTVTLRSEEVKIERLEGGAGAGGT
jgi:uncharacterized protein (TIGR02271 family)